MSKLENVQTGVITYRNFRFVLGCQKLIFGICSKEEIINFNITI